MSLWSGKPFVAVRILGPAGQYPGFDVSTPSHLFRPTRDCTWSAVLQPTLSEDWEPNEVTPLVPEEVRLFSALALCEGNPWENGLPLIANGPTSFIDPPSDDAPLGEPEVLARIQDAVGKLSSLGNPPEAVAGGAQRAEYNIREFGSCEDATDILSGIDSSDQLLLAGLSRFLGGSRLLFLLNEPEEAAVSLFISMGAALEFLRLHLCGVKDDENVAFAEVYSYLNSVYPAGSDAGEYFEDMYERRIIAMHPANRFGEFWAPPLMMDDVYWLQKHLIHLYRHIALGEEPHIEL